jgi:hypothetical protein
MTTERDKLVMVLLLGGRLTPNFLSILAYRPDIVECIVSEDEQSKWNDVGTFLSSILHVQLAPAPHIVHAYEMHETIQACQNIVESYPEATVIFNVTGATKIMGIAAYDFAKQAMRPAIYVDTAHGRFLNLTQLAEEPFPIRLNLTDYLNFYGRQPLHKFNFGDLSVHQEQALQASIFLASSGAEAVEAVTLLRQQNRGKGRRMITVSLKSSLHLGVWKILEQLNQLELITDLTRNSETNFSYTIPNLDKPEPKRNLTCINESTDVKYRKFIP